jgi:poly(3-hydroxyalkanoate) synthetase
MSQNLATLMTDVAAAHGDRPASRLDDVVLSWGAVDEASARLAGVLRAKGVAPGERVGIMLPNVPYFPIGLLGQDPPAFDTLYWNDDTTNMPAALHRHFMEIALAHPLVRPGERVVLGTPVDLSAIDAGTYLVAGIADHITPWESCYRTTQLLGCEPRIVLFTSGHIAATVNPPGNERASYQTADGKPTDPQWLGRAGTHRGTWWEDWTRRLAERSGPARAAPKSPGGRGHRSLGAAPGTYVQQ